MCLDKIVKKRFLLSNITKKIWIRSPKVRCLAFGCLKCFSFDQIVFFFLWFNSLLSPYWMIYEILLPCVHILNFSAPHLKRFMPSLYLGLDCMMPRHLSAPYTSYYTFFLNLKCLMWLKKFTSLFFNYTAKGTLSFVYHN